MAKNRELYDSKAWQVIRSKHLRLHRYCVICRQLGLFVLASEVDHIEAARLGGSPGARWNLQSLCKTHHSQKTASGPEHGSFIAKRPFTVIGPDGYSVPAGLQPHESEE